MSGRTEGGSRRGSGQPESMSRRSFNRLVSAGALAARFANTWPGRIAIGAAAAGPGSEIAELTKTE